MSWKPCYLQRLGGNKRQHYAISLTPSPPSRFCPTLQSYKYHQRGSNSVKREGGMWMGRGVFGCCSAQSVVICGSGDDTL